MQGQPQSQQYEVHPGDTVDATAVDPSQEQPVGDGTAAFQYPWQKEQLVADDTPVDPSQVQQHNGGDVTNQIEEVGYKPLSDVQEQYPDAEVQNVYVEVEENLGEDFEDTAWLPPTVGM